jgi:hypothetical protein
MMPRIVASVFGASWRNTTTNLAAAGFKLPVPHHDAAGGVVVVALFSGQSPVATLAGMATFGAYRAIHLFGWYLDDAIA